MAVALQASLLDGDEAELFRARERFGAFGTLPPRDLIASVVRNAVEAL
jgi:hypothetical protein